MIEKLIKGNKKFREEIFIPGELGKLSEGQNPKTCWIGCSDSRVPPAIITSSGNGDLFAHRNIANIVPPHHPETGAVLEYAVMNLKVKQIVVCGHYGCGGIAALLQGVDHRTHIGHWLKHAEESMHRVKKLPDFDGMKEDKILRLMVEENLRIQKANVMTYPFVRNAVNNKTLRVHMVVYDLKTGRLKMLRESAK